MQNVDQLQAEVKQYVSNVFSNLQGSVQQYTNDYLRVLDEVELSLSEFDNMKVTADMFTNPAKLHQLFLGVQHRYTTRVAKLTDDFVNDIDDSYNNAENQLKTVLQSTNLATQQSSLGLVASGAQSQKWANPDIAKAQSGLIAVQNSLNQAISKGRHYLKNKTLLIVFISIYVLFVLMLLLSNSTAAVSKFAEPSTVTIAISSILESALTPIIVVAPVYFVAYFLRNKLIAPKTLKRYLSEFVITFSANKENMLNQYKSGLSQCLNESGQRYFSYCDELVNNSITGTAGGLLSGK